MIERDTFTTLITGEEPQYFFDDAIVEMADSVTRIIHQPMRLDGPVLTRDKPWEHILHPGIDSTVWRDALPLPLTGTERR